MVKASENELDIDGDGRPDEFERDFNLNWDPESPDSNDIEWTFLVYVCGDDAPAGDPSGSNLFEYWEFIERLSWVGCTDNINIVVQFDGSDVLWGETPDRHWDKMRNNHLIVDPIPTSTRRFLVGTDSAQQWDPDTWNGSGDRMKDDILSSLWDVTDWPSGDPRVHNETDDNGNPNWEANMADPNTLFEFVDWGMDTFPSDHYCLYIRSHGLGVEGFGYDYRPNNNNTTTELDVITLPEMNTLSSLFDSVEKRLDLVNLYSCFMGNLEFGFKFLEFSDYHLASENWMVSSGNQDDDTLSTLESNPDWDPQRLAQEFIDDLEYWTSDGIENPPFNVLDWTPQFGNISMTYSVLNASHMTQDLFDNITSFNKNLSGGLSGAQSSWYNTSMWCAVNVSSDRYPDDTTYPRLQIDYYYFLNYWGYQSQDPPVPDQFFSNIRTSARQIMSVLWNSNPANRLIEYEKHCVNLTKTRGIAIYFPDYVKENIYDIRLHNTPMDWLYWWHVIEDCIRLGLLPSPR
ncbi:MAG: clostripain-related cysteine peptidase [Candidatus Thermoplasmatota archaeon]|nr:clostripain-related cysteine peptidase [Candidatus Thermoplasmatota archaeon]